MSDNNNNSNDIDEYCAQFRKNQTYIITSYFEGIPDNLIINVAVFVALILVYTLLRYIGDYGRFGLLQKHNEYHPTPDHNRRKRKVLSSQKSLLKNVRHNSVDERIIAEAVAECDEVKKYNREKQHATGENNGGEETTQMAEDEMATSQQPRPSSSLQRSPLLMPTTSRGITVDSHEYKSQYKDKYLFSWLTNLFKLKDEHIYKKCGTDARNYLAFQRYLIVYLFIVSILSISILLPINITANSFVDKIDFSSTTIINIPSASPLLWFHLVLSWIYLLLGLVFMRHFSRKFRYTEADYVSCTAFIRFLPESKKDIKKLLEDHFREAYPYLKVTDIQVVYDISKLNKLDIQKRSMHIGKVTSENILMQTHKRPLMHPYHFGSFIELCCCCFKPCCKQQSQHQSAIPTAGAFQEDQQVCCEHLTDAIRFYERNERDLAERMRRERRKTLEHPLGLAFVTFETKAMCAQFLKDYQIGTLGYVAKAACLGRCYSQIHWERSCFGKYMPNSSSVSEQIKSERWSVKYAPSPNNIKWENLSGLSALWWTRWGLINIILLILMIFFTTPSIIIQTIQNWATYMDFINVANFLPARLRNFLPSLLLRCFSSLIPILVACTALIEKHWTRSAENRSMMLKTFIVLLLMWLILPTFGITSLNGIIGWYNDPNFKWLCVADNGSFSLNYVITCSFIGCALDLLRISELLWYLIKMLWSRSSAERLAVRLQVAFEFDYGFQYAWILTIFTITLSFSVTCPLICPCGLLYLLMKHTVDRYNIYFAYVKTKVDKNIHKSAVTFAVVSFIILQFTIFIYIVIFENIAGKIMTMTVIQLIILVILCFLLIGRLFFGVFKRFSIFNQFMRQKLIHRRRQQVISVNVNDTAENDDLLAGTSQAGLLAGQESREDEDENATDYEFFDGDEEEGDESSEESRRHRAQQPITYISFSNDYDDDLYDDEATATSANVNMLEATTIPSPFLPGLLLSHHHTAAAAMQAGGAGAMAASGARGRYRSTDDTDVPLLNLQTTGNDDEEEGIDDTNNLITN